MKKNDMKKKDMKKKDSGSRNRLRAPRVGLALAFVALGVLKGAGPAEATPESSDPDLTAARIVELALQAAGGEALQTVRSLRREGTIGLSGPMFGELSGTWTALSRPGRSGYQLADFGQGATATGWNGTLGWEEGVMGVRELTPTEVAINRVNWEVHLLAALEREGKLGYLTRSADALVGSDTVYVLELGAEGALSADVGTRIFVDPESFLVKRVHMTLHIPQLGPSAVVHDYSDYVELEVPEGGSVRLPRRIEQSIENVFDLDIVLSVTEINGTVEDQRFEMPGA